MSGGGAIEYWWAPAYGLYNGTTGTILPTVNGSTVYASPQENGITYRVIGIKTVATGLNCYAEKIVDDASFDNVLSNISFKLTQSGSTNNLDAICGNDNTNIYKLTAKLSNNAIGNTYVTWEKYNSSDPPIVGKNPLKFSNSGCSGCIAIPTENEEWVMTYNPGGGACSTKRIYSLKVDPDVRATVAKDDFCTNEMKVHISTVSPPNSIYTYSWTPSTGLYSTTNDTVNFRPLATPTLTTSYTYTVSAMETNATSCTGATNNSEVTFTVSPIPYQGLSSIPTSPSSPITVLAGTTVHIILDNGGQPNYIYVWSPGHGLSNVTGSDVYASPLTNITYTVNVNDIHATNGAYGCCSYFEIPVIVTPYDPVCPNCSTFVFCVPTVYNLSVTQGVGLSYQWYRSGNPIAGATNNIFDLGYYINNIQLAGTFYCVVANTSFGLSYTSYPLAVVPNMWVCRLEDMGYETDTLSQSDFLVYPNPASRSFNIIAPGFKDENDVSIEVINTLGNVIYSRRLNNFNGKAFVNLHNLNIEGMYFVRLIGSSKVQTAKLSFYESD